MRQKLRDFKVVGGTRTKEAVEMKEQVFILYMFLFWHWYPVLR